MGDELKELVLTANLKIKSKALHLQSKQVKVDIISHILLTQSIQF